MNRHALLFILAASVSLAACKNSTQAEEEGDPADVALGERLFKETRFAQFFATHGSGEVNQPLGAGDPAVAQTETTGAAFPGPFAGQSMNCASCHLVDQHLATSGGGMRTYADFARRSPIPARDDGKTHTVRNSPPLVGATLADPDDLLLHFDGEFATLQALVEATLTGRNYGWKPGEAALATAQVAKVIREDDGSGALAREFGGSYRRVFAGLSPEMPIPLEFRMDVAVATDAEIFDLVSRRIAVYVDQLRFIQGDAGEFLASPFDFFLRQNRLPSGPQAGESPRDYSRRLRAEIAKHDSFVFLKPSQGMFRFHDQPFQFGPEELAGLRAFLSEPAGAALSAAELAAGGTGNCIACHAAPVFTDSGVHNTGVTQREYDGIHGAGAFALLIVPTLAQRDAAPALFLPATGAHPNYAEPFRAVPAASDPRLSDLGVWNVFANDDFPQSQARLAALLCSNGGEPCDDSNLLGRALATFKTPGLRDLGHSGPYMHDGGFDTLEDVADFYRTTADGARAGSVRNADPELSRIALDAESVQAIAAFLRALNEDYE